GRSPGAVRLGERRVVDAGVGEQPPVRRAGEEERSQVAAGGVVRRAVSRREQSVAPDVPPRAQSLRDPVHVAGAEPRLLTTGGRPKGDASCCYAACSASSRSRT